MSGGIELRRYRLVKGIPPIYAEYIGVAARDYMGSRARPRIIGIV